MEKLLRENLERSLLEVLLHTLASRNKNPEKEKSMGLVICSSISYLRKSFLKLPSSHPDCRPEPVLTEPPS
jgi:hypothetical protein